MTIFDCFRRRRRRRRLEFTEDTLVFGPHRRVYAHNCVVGLSLTDGELYTGYDAGLGLPADTLLSQSERLATADECVALAEEMIRQWSDFRDRYLQ